MEWKTIKGFTDYQVSDSGEVYSLKRNKKLKTYEKKNYLGVYLYQDCKRKFMMVHRLVALNFIDNPNNYPQINHKDENSKNNIVENLEWCSAKYNVNYGNHNKRLSESLRKSMAWKGRKHTQEAKEKMRNAKLGRTLTEEHRKKIGLSNKGKGRKGNSVYCAELDKTFSSALEAEREINIPNTNIIQVCLGKRKTAGGYHWQYKNKIKGE